MELIPSTVGPKPPAKVAGANGVSLTHLLHFFDVHSGSMQAISAIVLVIVTIIYTVLTRKMAKAAADALRPYVYLDFTFYGSGTLMILTIGNSGSKAAANVRVKLIKSTRDDLTNLFAPLPLAAIGQLPPGGTRRYSLVVRETLWPDNQPSPVLNFEIAYNDGRHKQTETQRIDFEGYRASAPENVDRLNEIASALQGIRSKMPTKTSTFLSAVCPYCGSGISSSAQKCPNCLEWVSGRRRPWKKHGVRPIKSGRPRPRSAPSNG